MTTKRFGRFLITMVAATALIVSMVGFSFAADTIKIGIAGAHSGDLASYGIPASKAAELIAKKVNAAGGINGKKIELLVQDDQCKPEMATNVATKLISDGVDVVMGHICSGATKAALNIYKESNIILMSPSATNPDLTLSGDYPNFYRTIAHDAVQAMIQVDFAIKKLGAKKVAVLHDKGDYGKGQAELAKANFEKAGVEVTLFEGVTPGAVDYTAIVQKVKRAKVDVITWGGYHPEASKIVGLLKKKKVKAYFLGADGLKDDITIKVAGKAAEGIYATGPRDITKNPMYIQAKNEHKAAYNADPGAFFDTGYSAMLALVEAVKIADSTDYKTLTKTLQTMSVETAVGKIGFDKKGDATGVGFNVYQVKGGKWVVVQ